MTLRPERVEGIHDPRLDPFRSLRSRSAAGETISVADGIWVLETLLAYQVPLHSLLVAEDQWPRVSSLLAAAGRSPDEVPVVMAPAELFTELVGYRYHRGVMAAVVPPTETAPLEVLGDRIAVLSGLDKGENIGAIARNALAFGFRGLLLDRRGASPYQRNAIRASRGTVFGLAIRRTDDLRADLRSLGEHGTIRVATALDGSETLRSWRSRLTPGRAVALLFGSEGEGLPDDLRAESDVAVRIPIAPEVESLNVASAAAVMFAALADPEGIGSG